MGNVCKCCTSQPLHAGSPPPPAVTSPQRAGSPPPLSLESLIHSIQQIDPNDQIDPLIELIIVQLQRIKASPKKTAPTFSSPVLDSVASNTSLAAKIVDTISKEADNLSKTDLAKELGGLVLDGLKMVGEAHYLFLGLSVAAYALERGVTMRSNVSDCIDLLEDIGLLAQDLKQFKEANPGKIDRLCKAVQIIVEGAIICCEYISKGSISRYLSATREKDFLQKMKERIRDVKTSLISYVVLTRRNTRHPDQSIKLLEFEPVGIESQVSDVENLLDMESSEAAVVVILLGNGGVGKTTLASQVIQQLNLGSAGFKFCRVIVDDQTPDKISHIIKLQRDIIQNLEGGKIKLQNPENGQKEIKEILENKFVLLFIDNVVDSDYIKRLLPRHLLQLKKTVKDEHSQKLRIVITSRASNLPVLFEDIKCKEYRVNSLSDEAAKMLLRQTVLKDGCNFHPDFEEERLLDDVAMACKGFPLLLSVYGNHLRVDRKKIRYDEALDGLRKGELNRFPEEQLEEKLLFVYHKLKDFDVEAPEAFLDICCYFQGWKWEEVSAIVGENRLEALHKRTLVSRSEIKNQVLVHDILLLMGRKEAKHTRFLNSKESLKAFEDKKNLHNVKGVSLLDNTSLMTFKSEDLSAMHSSLRVLQLGNWVNFEGCLCNVEFENLRYLQVGDINVFPFEDASKLKQLKVFYNHSKQGIDLPLLPEALMRLSHDVKQLEQVDEIAKLPEWLKLPTSLRYLQLNNFEVVGESLSHLQFLESLCLDKCDIDIMPIDLQERSKQNNLPKGLKLPMSLQNLILNNCKGLPQTLNHLNALKELFLTRCDVEIMPQGFNQLSLLKTLSLEHCTKLTSLPQGVGSITSLTSVNLHGCTRLQELPADFGKLIALKNLRMGGCENLTALPENIGGLSSLQELDLSGCIKLRKLPESFGSLSLQWLTLNSLSSLKKLPETIGNMVRLKYLSITFCNSLTSLPDSFVQLSMLEVLHIYCCENISCLPNNFGLLSSLTRIDWTYCPSLKELPCGSEEFPHGFETLRALKELGFYIFRNLVRLPASFEQFVCLELLLLQGMPISSLPSGFGKLKSLKWLWIRYCNKLPLLPDDFEEMASLEKVTIHRCEMMEGKELERVVKLQKCYKVDIWRSPNLVQRWKEMQQRQEDYTFEVNATEPDEYEWHRATKVGLFHGRCIEQDSSTHELIDHTSVSVGENTTVAVINLPFSSNHSLHLQRLVGRAMQRHTSGTTEQLRIFYLKKAEEQDTEEEESIREVLKQLPEGSWVIPSSEIRRLLLIQHLLFSVSVKDVCFIADVMLDDKGRQIFVDSTRIGEDEIVGRKISPTVKQHSENVDVVKGYIDQISSQNKLECAWKIFTQKLKQNGICHFDSKKGQVEVDQLEGKEIALIMCDFNSCACMKLQQIYGHLQNMHVDFEVVWIPSLKNEDCGYGSFIQAIQNMPWISLPKHKFVNKQEDPRVILFDRRGIIVNQNALTTMLAWGANAYPFTNSKIREFVPDMHNKSKSSLEFLLDDTSFTDCTNIHVTESINNKLTFLYAEPPNDKLKMKSKLEQLLQLYKDIEILYIGRFFSMEQKDHYSLKKEYENATQGMNWNRLSFSDMVQFWYRCKYLKDEEKELNSPIILQGLVKHLYEKKNWLVLLDTDGIVTASGIDVVEFMIHGSNDKKSSKVDIMMDAMITNLSSGKCDQMAKDFFTDELSNYPHHPQHALFLNFGQGFTFCNVCSARKYLADDNRRVYYCKDCDWDLCGDCWEVFAEKQIKT